MINYGRLWKDKCGFTEFTINEFIDKFKSKKEHYIYTEKIDGQFAAFVYKEGEKSYLLSLNNKKIEDIDVIYEYEKLIKNNTFKSIKEIIIIGDLTAIINGKNIPFNQSQSVIKTPHSGNNSKLIYHFVYDIFSINEVETNDYKKNLYVLIQLFKNKSEKIQVVKESWGTTDKLQEAYDKLIEIHAPAVDGIVVRTYRGMKAYKIKIKNTYDAVVIGVGNTKMKNFSKEQISYLIVAFMDKDGNFITTSKIGTGFSRTVGKFFYDYAQKFKLYETEKGDIFVKPRIIVEVSGLDKTRKDMPAYKFNTNKQIYTYIGNKAGATLRMPVFIRIRPDKKVNKEDIRISQVL